MYKWNIKVFLRNGEIIRGKFIGPQTNSGDVGETLIHGQSENSWFGLSGMEDGHNIIIRLGDVAAIDISLPDQNK